MEKVKVTRAKVKNAKWLYITLAVIANITLIINAIHHW
jgi:hypothetical protein